MKKQLSLLFVGLLFFLCSYQTQAQIQMNNWAVPPNKINFSTGTASASSLVGSSATAYVVSNSAFDENQNLLFYVIDGSIYNSSGTFVAAVASGSGGIAINSEIAIVPVPGSCKQFYVIWSRGQGSLTSVNFEYATVTVTGATVTVSSVVAIQTAVAGNLGGIAVSKLTGSTRYLYCVSEGLGIKRFTISSTGIASGTTLYSTVSWNNDNTELDLSHDGVYLAWGSRGTAGKVNIFNTLTLTPSSYTITPIVGSNIQYPTGVEFSADGSKLFVSCASFHGTHTPVYDGGIYVLTTSTGAWSQITFNGDYDNTQLELARDGNIYAVKGTGTLGIINPSTNAVSASPLGITIYSNGINAGGNYYKLPDQIDGENYDYFFGTPRAISNFNVNGSAISPTVPVNTFTCSNITLNSLSTGGTSYQVTLNSSTYAGIITGTYSYTTGWLTGAPSTVDLKALDASHLATNTGYYLVKYEVKNVCSASPSAVTGLIEVSSISAASSNFELNVGTGASSFPVQTLPGYSTCALGVSLSGSFSTGYIATYQITIDQVNCTTGVPGPNVYTGPANNVTNGDPNNIAAVNLNSIAGAYFYFNPGLCFKLTYTVANACGSSSNWGYFTTVSGCRLAAGTTLLDTPKETSVSPNPVSDISSIYFSLTESKPVTLVISDSQGRPVNTILNNEVLEAGEHTIPFDATSLPSGMYFYQLVTDKITNGKIIKE